MQKNQFVTTNKTKILQGIVKVAVSDASMYFRTDIWIGLYLNESAQTSLILQRQLQGYKTVDTPTKYQKVILEKLVLCILKK